MDRPQGWPIAVAGFVVGMGAQLVSQHALAAAAMLIGIVGLGGIWAVRGTARRSQRRADAALAAGRLERRLDQHVALIHSRHPLAGPHATNVSETPYLPVVRNAAVRF